MVTADPAVCALPQQPPVIHIQAPTAPEPAITDQIRSFMFGSSLCGFRGALFAGPSISGFQPGFVTSLQTRARKRLAAPVDRSLEAHGALRRSR